MMRFLRGLLVLCLLVAVAAGLSGRLSELLPLDLPTSLTSSPSAETAPAPVLEAADQDANSAVQQVIQRSNDEQVQAIASKDPSLMADTLTSDHLAELVAINQDLLNNG